MALKDRLTAVEMQLAILRQAMRNVALGARDDRSVFEAVARLGEATDLAFRVLDIAITKDAGLTRYGVATQPATTAPDS